MGSTDNYVCGNLLGLLGSLSVEFKFFLGLRKIQTEKNSILLMAMFVGFAFSCSKRESNRNKSVRTRDLSIKPWYVIAGTRVSCYDLQFLHLERKPW